ncbi:MAG: hypothetical protein N2690_00310 [Rhodocyclaceae bacterium]|nr:hypothetical protein [Rhodocyclaceae bacterium]
MAGETHWQRGFAAGHASNELVAKQAMEAVRMAREDAARANAMLTEALMESERRADALLDHLDTLAMHAHRDILDDWVCIPACEWDAVMAQVFVGGTHER